MLIERTKVKKPESMVTYFGEGLSGLGRFIAGIGDGLQYRIEEKEVKEVRHE
jgi:hypothetical protein